MTITGLRLSKHGLALLPSDWHWLLVSQIRETKAAEAIKQCPVWQSSHELEAAVGSAAILSQTESDPMKHVSRETSRRPLSRKQENGTLLSNGPIEADVALAVVNWGLDALV